MHHDGEELTVTVPWGKISLVSWGDPSNSPVLLVHGRQDSAATFIPLVQLLPKTFYYVGLDMPGNGKSDYFPKGLVISRYHFIPTLDYVVEYMGWKHFIYMGHSMGCETGLFWNAIRPGIISKFIFLDAGPSFQRLQPLEPQDHYRRYYERYYSNYYRYNNTVKEYTKKEVLTAVMKARRLTEAQAEVILSRSLVQIAEDTYRLNSDPRNKYITPQNMENDYYKQLFTTHLPPSLLISMTDGHGGRTKGKHGADELIDHMMKCRNFNRIILEGGHDHHFTCAGEVAKLVSEFLCKNFGNSKL